MEIKLIELYCLICRLYDSNSILKHQRLSNFKPLFTDQELLTCYFLAMLNHQHNQQEIYTYISCHWSEWFPNLPSYQAFNYRLNQLSAAFALIFDSLLQAKLRHLDWLLAEDSVIDSFPVMLKKGKPAKSCRTASQMADFGYCSSKDIYYWGVKLHHLAIRRPKTLPLPFQIFLTPASKHDLIAFKEHHREVPTQNLFADKAYQDQQLKADLQAKGVNLLTPYKRKKNEPIEFNEPLWSKFVSSFRQPIESFFNWLNQKTDYQNASRVRSTNGLLVHCWGKLAFAGLLLCFYS
jgi:hypothetical protein